MTMSGTELASGSSLSKPDLERLHAYAHDFARLSRGQFGSSAAMFNAVVEGTHRLMGCIDSLEHHHTGRDRIEAALAPATHALSASPFVARLQTWPRGYPGDFETIEYLCDGVNKAETETLGFYCEAYYLHSAPACQHRNKLEAQSQRIRDVTLARPDANILVLGAGGGRDLLQALPWLERSRARLVLNDIEPDALALCQQRLSRLGDRVTVAPGNGLAVGRFVAAAPFDLVLAGGLFDYVATPVLIRTLRRMLLKLLRPDGQLFFTNIAQGNVFRSGMEYLLNWPLIERSPHDLLHMLQRAGIGRDSVRISQELTGLAYLVDVVPQSGITQET